MFIVEKFGLDGQFVVMGRRRLATCMSSEMCSLFTVSIEGNYGAAQMASQRSHVGLLFVDPQARSDQLPCPAWLTRR